MGVVNVSFVGVSQGFLIVMSLFAEFIYLLTILFTYCTALPLWNQDALSKSPGNMVESKEYLKEQGLMLMLRDEDGNSTTAPDSLDDCRTSGLCPEGIANIVAGLSAMLFLSILACVLWHWEVQLERRTRVRLALERNRTIDRQMAEDKKKRQKRVDNFIAKSQQQEEEEGTVGGGASLVERSLQEVTSDSELSSDEHKQLLSVKTRAAQELTVAAEIS